MYFKNMDFLIDLYKNFNEVGIFAVIYIIYALIQILSQNILYKRQKMERVKTLIINIILYIFITLVALMYLLAMIFYSLSAYPKEEVIKYITDWDKISLPAILLVLYSLLFPIFIFPIIFTPAPIITLSPITAALLSFACPIAVSYTHLTLPTTPYV